MKDNWYIRLQRDFYNSQDIRVIRKMPNGSDYIIIWQKLLLLGCDSSGELRFKDDLPYTDILLATILEEDVDYVRSALKVFASLHMIRIDDQQTIWIEAVVGLVGKISSSADRVRLFRERQKRKLLTAQGSTADVTDVTPCNTLHVTQSKSKNKNKNENNISMPSELVAEEDSTEPSATEVSKSSATEYPATFETLWAAYPRKLERKGAYRAWHATLRRKTATEEELQRAVMAYASTRVGQPEKFTKLCKTFLGPDEHWRDYLDGNGKAKPETPDQLGAALFGRG